MAIITLKNQKKIELRAKRLSELKQKADEMAKRESELEADLAEVESEEDMALVEEEIDKLNAEKAENKTETEKLESEISELEAEIKEAEEKQKESRKAAEAKQKAENSPTLEERKDGTTMKNTRTKFFGMNVQERDAFIAREDVKNYIDAVRAVGLKRAVSGADLLIPDVMLELVREQIENYSLLMGKVRKSTIKGNARQNISGGIPEAIWTEACATLNELDLKFYQTEFDGFKVGGYIAICNATLEDSDLNLASEIITAISRAIGYAIDKAICYGKGAASKMPIGIMTRLCQTTKPSDWGVNDRPWVNLSTSNVITIASASKATTLFQEIIKASAKAKKKYATGGKIWIMNETTHLNLTAEALTINANGAIVSGIQNTMPIVGGEIIELDFIPDNVIICGYAENYRLIERSGMSLGSSKEARFLQDETLFAGRARYDGKPVIGEAFVAIGINGVTPTDAMTFPQDTANANAAA